MELKPPVTSFEIGKMPVEVYSVPLSLTQRERLSKGHSLFLENMELPEGRVVDGKISFVEVNKEPHLKMIEKKPFLEIPKKVAEHTLTEDEHKNLLDGKAVALPIKPLIFLQVDKELNRVIVKTEKDLGIPQEIGGYTLTDKDKELFANNQPLPLRVYLNPKTNSYFLATITRTEDGKGIEFTDYKALDKGSVPKMLEKYNVPANPLNDMAKVTSELMGDTTTAAHPAQKVSKAETTTKEKTENFEKHLHARDLSAIKSMTDNGFTVTSKHLETITEKYGYKPEEKLQINSTVKINNKTKEQSLSL
jgi:hypothetical protein